MKFNPELTMFTHHPAFIAWNKISPKCKEPNAIELLTQKNGKPHNEKSLIYRLSGVGINGNSVIAKKASLNTLINEKFIYEKILPLLPIPSLYFYGFVFESDNKTAWIFLEEGEGRNYSEEKEADRILAAKWLGLFHSVTSQLDNNSLLKEHGAEHYYEYIKSGHIELSTNLTIPYIKNNDKAILKKIILNFDVIDSKWATIAKLCDQMPRCIVHGDLIKKT